MTTVMLTPLQAFAAARAAGVRRERMNPVYRTLLRGEDPSPFAELAAGVGPGTGRMLARQLCAPALLVLAVHAGGPEGDGDGALLRAGIGAGAATLERSEPGEDLPLWEEAALEAVPGLCTALLPAPLADAPVRLTVEQGGGPAPSGTGDLADPAAGERPEDPLRGVPLRLSRSQLQQLAADPLGEVDPAGALERLEGLPDRLRDALTATGPRISLTLCLHRPGAGIDPLPLTRLWVQGQQGLYRADAPGRPDLTVVPVADGDVHGSLLALLDQAVRFAAAADPVPVP